MKEEESGQQLSGSVYFSFEYGARRGKCEVDLSPRMDDVHLFCSEPSFSYNKDKHTLL